MQIFLIFKIGQGRSPPSPLPPSCAPADLLIFKLQQEVLKFSDVCLSWSSAKTDIQTNFLHLFIEVSRTSVFLNGNVSANI